MTFINTVRKEADCLEWRDLGLSGLRVPVVGMGTWRTFDVYGKEDQAARRALVDEALDLSIRFLDSSPMYGEAERVLGTTLTGRRDRAIVATKVWSHDLSEGHGQIDRALQYFENRVDLYQVHNLVRWRDYLPVFERMKADGTIRATGVTHYQPAAFPELATIALTEPIDTIQIPYNPFERAVEQEILPLAAERQLGVIVMRPFGEGSLLRQSPPSEALQPFRRFGCTNWPQVLLKWVLSDPRVSVVIPATRDAAHLRGNAAAGDGPWFGSEERAEVTRLAQHYCR
jgi:aryl-alcohol dehydrogenase-like predicted oxidoreductase